MNQQNKKIFFILNTLGLTGGVKVVFEHANMLSRKGYEVEIIHLLKLKNNIIGTLIACLKKIKYKFKKNIRPNWFYVAENIKIRHIISLKKITTAKNDIVIATANETADHVNNLNLNNKFYFIQDYEIWTRRKELVDATYTYNLKKIVVSKNLKELINERFKQSVLGVVPNGIDFEFFKCENKKNNQPINILMLYHPLPKKGFATGIKAIERIKKIHPFIKLIAFGAYKNPKNNIIDKFYYQPDKETIKSLYTKADIFLYPALEEGFGLTLLEAAAAKCALVTTPVGWTTDFGKNNENLVFVKKEDYLDMVNKIQKLINEPKKIQNLGNKAAELAREFTWEKSNNILEKLLDLKV